MSAHHKALARVTRSIRNDCKTDGAKRVFDHLLDNSPDFREWAQTSAGNRLAGNRDAFDLPFSAHQLEEVIEEAVVIEFPELCFADQANPLVQWDMKTVREGAKLFRWRIVEYAGHAQFIATMGADGLPSPTVMGSEVVGKVEELATQIRVRVQELRAAAFAGEPLETQLGVADRRAHSELINETAAWGRSDLGLPGFLNNQQVGRTPAPLGAAASPHWNLKTPVEKIADVLGLLNSIPEDTDELFKANTVAMAQRYLRDLAQTRLGQDLDGTSDTVMEYLDKALGKANMPVEWRGCEDLRASNSFGNLDNDAVMAFDRDPKRVVLIVPFFYKIHPTQQHGFNIDTPTESAIGGMLFRFPLSAAMLTNIGNS